MTRLVIRIITIDLPVSVRGTPPPDAQPPKPPKPTAPKQRSVDVVDMTPHGGSSSSSPPPDIITRGAAMGGGGTIQHFHAGAFAAGSNIYLAAPGGQSDAGGSHAHAAQLAHGARLAHGGLLAHGGQLSELPERAAHPRDHRAQHPPGHVPPAYRGAPASAPYY